MLVYRLSLRVGDILSPCRTHTLTAFFLLVLHVLRMIKLFGWERKMEERVYEKRQEELVWIKKRQFIEVLNAIVK